MSAAVTALGNIGPGAKEAVPLLIKTLSIDDSHYNVRASAVEALGKIGHNAREAIPKLISLVDNKDQHLRYEAIRALGGMGSSGKPAIPKLIKALEDPYEYAASSAAYSLARIQVATEEVVNALIEAMNDGREVTSYAQALGKLGPKAGKAVPSLIRIMRGSNRNIGAAGIGRYHAIMALGEIGGEEAIDGLKSMQTARNPNIRDVINKALRVAQSKKLSVASNKEIASYLLSEIKKLERYIGLAVIAATPPRVGGNSFSLEDTQTRVKEINKELKFLEKGKKETSRITNAKDLLNKYISSNESKYWEISCKSLSRGIEGFSDFSRSSLWNDLVPRYESTQVISQLNELKSVMKEIGRN